VRYMLSEILLQRDHAPLLRGLLYTFILATPVNLFVAIMGGGSPQSKGFLYSLGIVVGMELGGTLALLVLLKLIDSLLSFSVALTTFSYPGLFLCSIAFVVLGNVFIDNLYQFNQGNYGISITALFLLAGFWLFVLVIGSWSPFRP